MGIVQTSKALPAVIAATLCACSLLTSLDEYSNGGPGGPGGEDGGPGSLEGGADGSADPLADGASDAPLPEAGPDAATDAAGKYWCATHAPTADFCVDFEERGLDLFDGESTKNGTLGSTRSSRALRRRRSW